MSAHTTRRGLLGAAGAMTGALLLAACGTDASDRYSSGDSGYVSGDGVATEIAPTDRAEPLDIQGTTFEDDEFSSADHLGEVLMLNIWYASCPPCRKEAPELQKIHEDYEELVVIGVNVRDSSGPARAFEETYGITYPSMPDLDAEIMYSLRGLVAPNAVPSTLVIDREGRVAARISGAADPSTLRSMIDAVIAE
ncbi:thiol-disulfide isomerase [Brachybacterium ginsengisoli]|uniref:Thiol-disulfide isomerase n=1 Tax=Brachybacterium ginsengisoli TaxID=1331682 RepID=A0A291GVD5_9MICO|nr:TlpA disulfide reductase family protein [Brachybacterium ginsengisoli]ATG54086.1 thiol-disulfide isomerase [Brachybacterium ginsengisoli]